MRIVVILFLIAIIASLASALVFLFRDQGRERKRMVKALALRVGLSIMLFVILTAGAPRVILYSQYTTTNRKSQTTSTKCQYQATASKAK